MINKSIKELNQHCIEHNKIIHYMKSVRKPRMLKGISSKDIYAIKKAM